MIYNISELRIMVLGKSLKNEGMLSSVLATLFRFPKEGSMALGNKSNRISFKTKVDLLQDLGFISSENYTILKELMEIRNQFMHSRSVASMQKVAAYLGANKCRSLR